MSFNPEDMGRIDKLRETHALCRVMNLDGVMYFIEEFDTTTWVLRRMTRRERMVYGVMQA